MQEKLYFYYTNDIHSNFKQWSRVATYLKERKVDRLIADEPSWIIDIGDHIDRVHPIAEAFMGKANVQLLNDLGYDLVTIGNNEGITLQHDDLYHLYDQATFDVVCANLHNLKGADPQWLQRTINISTRNGLRIGVIGLTAPFNDFYELLHWHISSPYEVLKACVQELSKTTDIIVLLSHLGLSEDEEIARRFPDIDVIIGGHTHHLLRTGENVNNTIITAAGKHGNFIGEVILTWDHEKGKLINKEAYATEITHIARDLPTEQRLIELNEQAEKLLGKKVVTINKTLEVQWFRTTSIMQSLTDTMKQWTQADCAMLNAGLLLDNINAGTVTYGDVHRVCPHPINPVVVKLTGKELMEVIRAAFSKEFMELKLIGFGFRGEVIGRMVFSGLDVELATTAYGHEYVKQVLYQDKPLEADAVYKVATADTFTFGRLLPEITKSTTKTFFMPEFLRDLLTYTLKTKYDEKVE